MYPVKHLMAFQNSEFYQHEASQDFLKAKLRLYLRR